MKGVVFTEFMDLVEDRFCPHMVETIIEKSDVDTGGAYTTVGTYDYLELVRLVTALSKETDTPVADLVRLYGHHLFSRFAELFPKYFEGVSSSLTFLPTVDGYIHGEVRKLYPDAELPEFDCKNLDERSLRLIYRSKRPFADLAHGLIQGCMEHFGETGEIAREDMPCEHGAHSVFVITLSS